MGVSTNLRTASSYRGDPDHRAELQSLLDDVPDTLEIVLRRDAWSERRATEAGAAPSLAPGARSAPRESRYAAYRAAQDREDAAQDALRSDPDVPDQRLVAAVGRGRLGARLAGPRRCAG